MKRMMILVLAFLLVGAPASAAIRITRINFNPDGRDTGTKEHLRKEFIVIKNTGARRVLIDGWRLHDAGRDHTYEFGNTDRWPDAFTDLRLKPGEFVRLHSGRGQDTATAETHSNRPTHYDFYWDVENYVWNNDRDRATLKRPNRKIADRCAYTSSADSPVAC